MCQREGSVGEKKRIMRRKETRVASIFCEGRDCCVWGENTAISNFTTGFQNTSLSLKLV